MVQYYNQDIDISRLKIQSISITTKIPHVVLLQSYSFPSHPPPFLTLCKHQSVLHCCNFVISRMLSGTIQYVTFWGLAFFPYSIILWRFIQVVTCINRSLFFIVEQFSLVQMYYHLFNHSPVERHFHCVESSNP